MEDLDIIRHDMQPGTAARSTDFRDLPRNSAADFRDLPRVRGRASKTAAGLQSIINKIINS